MGSDFPDLNVSVTLPPEILGKILEQIPINSEGRRILVACALVATWWTGPSQRRLFSSVFIRESNYKRWMDGVARSGSKTHLLEYVRSLWHHRGLISTIKYRMQDLAQDSGEYFSALCNLHSLTLYNIRVEHINKEKFHTCFSAFREALTFLSLDSFATSFNAFVTLVDYFPNITSLQLRSFTLEPDDGPVPSLSRPLRGKVHIHHLQSDFLEFLDRFAKLDLEYEELVIGTSTLFMKTKFVASALQISTGTVKFLRLTAELRFGAAVTIQNFQQLRELELVVTWPSSPHKVFSSIASIELRKVIFPVRYINDWEIFAQQTEAGVLVDEQLCGLVDRLRAMGYRHTLEAELRLIEIGDDPEMYDFTIFLPGFREKGVVTIIDVAHGERLLHSSVRK